MNEVEGLKRFIFSISNLKEIQKYFLFLVFIMFLTPALFLLLDILNITTYIDLSKNYDWLGFFGGFFGGTFGGVATFLGVFLTLKYQRNSDYEKNRLSVIPILEYKISYDKNDFDNSNGQLAGEVINNINIGQASFQDEESLMWYFNLKIDNVGMGHAQVSNINMSIGDNCEPIIKEELFGYSYKLVKIGQETSFKFFIFAPKSLNVDDHTNGYSIRIIIQYQDLLGNKYNQQVRASIASSVLRDNNEIINRINHANLNYYENFTLISNKG